MLERAVRWLGVALMFMMLPAGAETLTVGGTGSAGPLVVKLFESFAKANPGASLNLILPPLGSTGGIRGVTAGKVDMAFVSRPLKPDEAARLGESFALATTAFVVVANDAQAFRGLTLANLADLYAGRTKAWSSGRPVRLVLRARSDSDTDMLRSMSAAMDRAAMAAFDQPGMTIAADDIEALDLLTRTAGSLGPTTLGLLRSADSRLQPVAIDGVTPSVSTMRNGSYPWRKTLVAVLPKAPTPLALRFAEYLRSGAADVVLRRYDFERPVERTAGN